MGPYRGHYEALKKYNAKALNSLPAGVDYANDIMNRAWASLGIGNSKWKYALVLALILGPGLPAWAREHHGGIWDVLRAGHFSGPMRHTAHVLPIKGEISANGTHYRFWEYRNDSKHSAESAAALLVFEKDAHGLSYLGCYRIDLDDFKGLVHPVIRGQTVFFSFS